METTTFWANIVIQSLLTIALAVLWHVTPRRTWLYLLTIQLLAVASFFTVLVLLFYEPMIMLTRVFSGFTMLGFTVVCIIDARNLPTWNSMNVSSLKRWVGGAAVALLIAFLGHAYFRNEEKNQATEKAHTQAINENTEAIRADTATTAELLYELDSVKAALRANIILTQKTEKELARSKQRQGQIKTKLDTIDKNTKPKPVYKADEKPVTKPEKKGFFKRIFGSRTLPAPDEPDSSGTDYTAYPNP